MEIDDKIQNTINTYSNIWNIKKSSTIITSGFKNEGAFEISSDKQITNK